MAVRKKGFTLIELLVVIAIIALLLSIVTPALKKAKDYSKRVICTSGVRQMGIALRTYANQNDDQLIPMFNPNANKYTSDASMTAGEYPIPWMGAIAYNPAYVLPNGNYRPFHLAQLFEQGYVGEPKIFYCPAQPAVTDYPIRYDYEWYTNNGSARWGTYIPIPEVTTVGQFVRTSYGYWLHDQRGPVRISRMGLKPLIFDNLQAWKVVPHRVGRGSSSMPQGLGALFSDGHVSFAVNQDLWVDENWPDKYSGTLQQGPNDRPVEFRRIVRVLERTQ